MRLTLQLTPEQAHSIINAWIIESQMAASDRNPIYPCDREPPPGQTTWTHGPAGYMTEDQERHRWLTAELNLAEVIQEADGNWVFRFTGDRNGLTDLARYPNRGLHWESFPIIADQ